MKLTWVNTDLLRYRRWIQATVCAYIWMNMVQQPEGHKHKQNSPPTLRRPCIHKSITSRDTSRLRRQNTPPSDPRWSPSFLLGRYCVSEYKMWQVNGKTWITHGGKSIIKSSFALADDRSAFLMALIEASSRRVCTSQHYGIGWGPYVAIAPASYPSFGRRDCFCTSFSGVVLNVEMVFEGASGAELVGDVLV